MKLTAIERNRLVDKQSDKPIQEAVEEWLANQADLRRVRLVNCADAFGYTEYGLRNRLCHKGYRYQDLLDQERRRRLDTILAEHDKGFISINSEKIAPIMGLSKGDVFRKWYKRQYGSKWQNRSKSDG